MTVGFPATKNDFDQRAGQLASLVRDTLASVERFQTLLAATPDATLQALGYSVGDVAQLKSAFADLNDLARVYRGLNTAKTLPYDYTQFAKLLVGVV